MMHGIFESITLQMNCDRFVIENSAKDGKQDSDQKIWIAGISVNNNVLCSNCRQKPF